MHTLQLQTNLAQMELFAKEKQAENDAFRSFLQTHEATEIDVLVSSLNSEITPLVDCTACGNCCKSLMIVVEESEADSLSSYLQMSRQNFDEQYVEKGGNGMMVMNAIPCHFLLQNKCSVYEHRFAGCREFPAMHLPQFNKRLFTTFMHYDRCPIIFNVIEALKVELGFENNAS